MKLSEYIAGVDDIKALVSVLPDQLTKVQTEILAKIAELEGQLANMDVPAEAEHSLNDVKATVGEIKGKVQAMDDWNADQPVP